MQAPSVVKNLRIVIVCRRAQLESIEQRASM